MKNVLEGSEGALYSVVISENNVVEHYIGELSKSDEFLVNLNPYKKISNLPDPDIILAIGKLEKESKEAIFDEEIFLGKRYIWEMEPLKVLINKLKGG